MQMTLNLRARWGAVARTAVIASALAAVASTATARTVPTDSREWGPVGGVTVTFTVPETRSDCTPAGMTDSLTTTGIPSNWRLFGRVQVGYIGQAGQFVVTQEIWIDQPGNLNLQIQYPPHSAITRNQNNIIEYHVSPSIEVYDQNNQKVSWVGGDLVGAPGTLGPKGQDWDVFCLNPPPPPPPPGALQGCTPGYWKVPQHWDSYPAGVTAATSFNSIFRTTQGVVYPLPTQPWAIALDGGGGPGVPGALSILRRAAAAAYLNALLPDNVLNYGYSAQQVVTGVMQAALSNNREQILALASILDQLNNRGCPLN
jgi:hypothetical protein